MLEFTSPHLDQYLPMPEGVELSDGVYHLEHRLSRFEDEGHFIRFAWEDMYRRMAEVVMKVSLQNRDKYVVYKTTPLVLPQMSEEDYYIVRLRLNTVFTFSQTSKIVVHEYHYSPITGNAVEWKCGYCGLPNKIEATFCGEAHKSAAGCGGPRNFIRSGGDQRYVTLSRTTS